MTAVSRRSFDLASAAVHLPTMYDLPSEDPEELGLPDLFHDIQPHLLSRTLRLEPHHGEDWLTASDLNLYYDPEHTLWHKRPDWVLVLGVPFLYKGPGWATKGIDPNGDGRQSYVMWHEKVAPTLVVELLSEGTDGEDLGPFKPAPKRIRTPKPLSAKAQAKAKAKPPRKFEVYEQILKIPHYIVYDASTKVLLYFRLIKGRYSLQTIAPTNPQLWIPELNLGIGLWTGTFDRMDQTWLRWCDSQGNWIQTDTEAAQAEADRQRQAKEQAEAAKEQAEAAKVQAEAAQTAATQQLQQVAQNLLDRGLTPQEVSQITGLTDAAIAQIRRPNP
jgi:Uma2 family endonuclease